MSAHGSTTFSALEVHADRIADIHDLRNLVERNQVVVIRGMKLSVDDQLMLTRSLGDLERAWEDNHPESEFLQLMDSRTQIRINEKSSSKYWHLDRSFMQVPTRFTLLHAVNIGDSARGTQFIDTRNLLSQLTGVVEAELRQLSAEHDFLLNFPRIMAAKGYESSHITALRRQYPPVVHPLVRTSIYGDSLYFSELCVGRVLNVDAKESVRLVEILNEAIANCNEIYEHAWRVHDTLIWDNYSTIHRARPEGSQGLRVLHRSTAS